MPPLGPPADTDPRAWQVYLGLMRDMPAHQKLARVFELNELVRSLMKSELQAQHPDWTEEDIFLGVAAKCIGEDLVRAAYGKAAPRG